MCEDNILTVSWNRCKYSKLYYCAYIEGLHLLLQFPPGALDGLVGAGLVRQDLISVTQLQVERSKLVIITLGVPTAPQKGRLQFSSC